jgi:hypothetical protein
MNIQIRRILFLLLFLSLGTTHILYAQSNPEPDFSNVNPPSPNAASLGQYGNYPTTLYNGLVNISIPVYDIKTPRFDIPISLSYHASGIKVTEVASWVGLGWALNTGGEITRQVMGNPDDKSQGYLSSGNEVKIANSLDLQTSNSDISYIQDVLNGTYDGEPDIFSYMFPGGEGHFLFNIDKTSFINIPEDKNKISVDFANNRITIVDKNGNTYIFGNSLAGTTYIETSTTYGPTTEGPDNSAWMLADIIPADKSDTIRFNYNSSYSTTYQDIYDYWTVSDDHMYTDERDPYGQEICPPIYKSGPGNNTQGTIDTYNTEYTLSEIDFKNGKVLFERNPNARLDGQSDTALQKIIAYHYDYASDTYKPIKTVTLFQSYFNNNDRLRLDSLQITGIGIAQPQTYKFSYDPTLLPKGPSLLQDYWGYYNSNPGATLIPQMQVEFIQDHGTSYGNITVGDANRNADTSRVKACSLERIDYPTGGYTQFVYESNQFDLNNVITYGGGLRIKEILNYDGISSKPQITYFKYGVNECGYGDFNIPGPSIQGSLTYSNEIGLYNYYNSTGCPVETIRQRTYSSTPDYSFSPLDGSPVFYPTVTEYQEDSTGATDGKTIYNYEYTPDALTFFVPNTRKTHIQTYIWRRGHLLDKTVYNKNNNIVSQETNTYSIFDEKLYDSISIVANQYIHYGESPTGGYSTSDPNIQNGMLYQYGSYSIQTGLELLTNNTKTTYNQNDPSKSITKTSTYSYDTSNYQPSSITVTNSKGENDITHLTYPPDYSITGTPAISAAAGMQYLQNNHVISPVIEKYLQKENADGSDLRTIGGILTTFKQNAPLPDSVFYLSLSSPSYNFSPARITYNSVNKNSNYIPMIISDQYDNFGNILQQHKINDVLHAYIWDYNNAYPIASVVNSAQSDIAYTSFEADGKGNWTFSGAPTSAEGGVTGTMAYSLASGAISKSGLTSSTNYIVSYWLYSGGSVSISGGSLSGSITGHTANNWTYHEVTVTGATGITISGSGYIDELRLYPAGSQMTTYTYEPLVGITSKCGPDNKIQYYDYDGLGRLQDIKDEDGNIIKTYDYHYNK